MCMAAIGMLRCWWNTAASICAGSRPRAASESVPSTARITAVKRGRRASARPCSASRAGRPCRTPGLHVARLFVYTPPRFYFKPREQALLWHALLDKTDEETAAALGLTVAAVKKRWAGIYDRVADIAPTLFPDAPEAGPAHRGQEKRRHLMRYLRLHPEELRPVEEPG